MEKPPYVRYAWQEGSVPPPHYYEYVVEAGPEPRGRIRFRPGYPFQGAPLWIEPFEAEPAAWQRVVDLLSGQDLLVASVSRPSGPQAVGGCIHTLSVRTPDTEVTHRCFGTPSGPLSAAIDAVTALVPEALWSDLRARRERFGEEVDGGGGREAP